MAPPLRHTVVVRRIRPVALAMALILVSCSSTVGHDPQETTNPSTTEAGGMPGYGNGSSSSTVGSQDGGADVDPGLQPLVDMAVADLAEKLGVAALSITLEAARLVTWPDSSLGCPQPGMEYLQVLTDGSVIELSAGGTVYEYHTGGNQYVPFLCTTPAKAGSGDPPATVDPPPADYGY